MRISKWIAGRVAPGYERPEDLEARTRIGLFEGWASIAANTLLAALKAWLGLVTGSLALMADAVHSFSDSGTSAIVIFGFRMARKPPDEKHPFGHGRSESIAGLVIAVLLGVIAVEMGRAGVERILRPQAVEVATWVIPIVLATMLVKELLAQFSRDLGLLIGSDVLIADAWHHRSDVLSTGLVIVAFMGPRWGAPWLDGAMSVGVAALIGWAALATMRRSLGPLLGEHAPEETYRAINEMARSVRGVRSVHDILVHRYGHTHVISLHVEVPEDRTPLALHELSERIEDKIAGRFPGHAIVHVDPVDRSHEHYARIKGILDAAVSEREGHCSYHDLRIVGGPDRFKVVFDVQMRPGASEKDVAACTRRMTERVEAEFPNATVHVNIEPPYVHPAPETGEV